MWYRNAYNFSDTSLQSFNRSPGQTRTEGYKPMRNGIMLGTGILCLSFATFAQGNKDNTPGADHGGKVVHETKNFAGGGGGSTTIVYHGGPVLLGTPTAYYIWYGTWDGSS